MPDINPSLPTVGQPVATEDPKIVTAFQALVAAVNDIDSAMVTDASITDADLASPNNAVWRTYRTVPFFITGGKAAGTYYLTTGGLPVVSGVSGSAPGLIVVDASEYAVAGKTAQARLVAHQLCNTVNIGNVLTWGLYPVSSVTGASSNDCIVTLGAVVASLASSFGTGTANKATGSAFALPTGDEYVLGFNLAGATAASNCLSGTLDLQVRFN